MAAGITIVCPGCGARSANAPAALLGRSVRCPGCGKTFKVEAPPPVPTVPEAAVSPTRLDSRGAALRPSRSESGPFATQRIDEWKVGDVLLDLYEVLGVLGEGGMGRVYKLRHRGWDLALAAKVPRPALLDAEGGAELFEREAETWVNLGLHPHTVTCFYVRRLQGIPVLFAEFVDGASMHERIRAGQLNTIDVMLDVAIQFAWGLHYAHEQGLVHLDVKPHNVMIGRDGVAKVTDFGLARARRFKPAGPAAPLGPAKNGETSSVEGAAGGTAAYMSPEHSEGRTLTRRSDLWSFGLSILEVFAGYRYWDFGVTAREALAEHLAHPDPALPRMPDSVAVLLARCFRDDPEERPRSLAEVANTLCGAYEAATGDPYPRPLPRSGQGTPDSLNNRAVSLVDLGRDVEAASLWKRALEDEPQHVEATYNQCLTAWTSGLLDDEEVLRRMGEVLKTHAGAARAHHLRGRLHLALADPGRAVSSLDEAVRCGLISPDLDRDHGLALLAPSTHHDPRRALACFERLLQAGSTEAGDLVGRSLALERLGRRPEALAFHAQAARERSDLPAALDAAIAATLPGYVLGPSLKGLAGAVSALTVSPDGSRVVAGHELEVRVWNAATASPARAPLKGESQVRALAVTTEGRFLLWGGENAALTVWDLEAGRPVRSWQRHAGYTTAIALAPDGRHAVTGGSDRVVRVFDLVSGECLRTLEGHEDSVTSVAVGPTRVVSGSRDGTVRVWDLATGSCLGTLLDHRGRVSAIALDEAGAQVLSAGDDRVVRLWGLKSLELVRTFAGHSQPVTALVLAPGGAMAWSGALDRTVRAFDLDRERVHSLVRLDAAVQALVPSPDGGVWAAHGSSISAVPPHARRVPPLALARPVSSVEVATHSLSFESRTSEARRLLDAGDLGAAAEAVGSARAIPGYERAPAALALSDELGARLLRQGLAAAWEEAKLAGHTDQVVALAVSADGGRLFSAGKDQQVRVWDVATSRAALVLSGHEGLVAGVATTRDGRTLASASWDRTVRLWDLASGRLRRVLQGHDDHVTSVGLSPDGSWLVSGSWDQTVRLWRPATGASRVLVGHASNVSAVAFGPDGRFVVSAGWDATARAWDVESGQAVCSFEGHDGNLTTVAVSPSGRHVASGGVDATVRLFELRSRRCLEVLNGHEAEITGLAFTPDARYLLSSSRDQSVRVWDLEKGACARTLPHPGPVLGMCLSPGGHLAYTGGADGLIRIWHLDWKTKATPSASWDETERASHWDEVRRSMPKAAALRPAPVVGRVVQGLPWRRMVLGFVALLAIALGVASWIKPRPSLRVVPYMAKTVLGRLDPIDLGSFKEPCSESRDAYRERARAREVSAPTLSCLARTNEPGVVSGYLTEAPLADPDDSLRDQRLLRNAVSLMLGLGDTAVEPLCVLLGDSRERVRRIAGISLARGARPSGLACLRQALEAGDSISRATAASVLDILLANGEIGSAKGFALVQSLARDADPNIRGLGLRVFVMFNAELAAAAVTPATGDPDPTVAQAAKETLAAIEAVRKVDALRYGS
jgi:WD40 repeat protein/serine/threonine protein kinase